MFKLAELIVEIAAHTSPFDAALRRTKGQLSSAFSGMKGLVAGGASALFQPLAGAARAASTGLKAAFLAMALGAAAGTAYAVDQASDLNETISKTETVFGQAAGTVKAAADEMADSLGIPKREFLDAASGIGLMGKAAKLSQARAAEMSISLAKLGADAASFYNIPLDEALIKIRAGLAGEAEPLRALGVLLNEAAVQAEAVRLGTVRAGQELTEGQKVIARASLITKGLTDANGDLVRTQDGVANRFREVQGRLQNLAADLGQYLLPAVKRLAGGFAEGVQAAARFVADNRMLFEEWAAHLEAYANIAVGAIKHWPEALEIVKEFAREKVTNIKEVFDWLLANVPPVMDRIAIAIRVGFVNAMSAAIDVVKTGAVVIADAMATALIDPAGAVAKLSGVKQVMMAGIGSAKPRDFQALNLSSSAALSRAIGNLFGKVIEDLDAEAAAKAAKAKDAKPLNRAMANPPAEVAQADQAAGRKKAKVDISVGDLDSFARQILEGGKPKEAEALQREAVAVAKAMDKKLDQIAKNTFGGGLAVARFA